MTEPIVSIAHMEQQARAAAAVDDCVNDPCPYSFYTAHGRIFRQAFMAVRLEKSVVAKPERVSVSNKPVAPVEPAHTAMKGVAV